MQEALPYKRWDTLPRVAPVPPEGGVRIKKESGIGTEFEGEMVVRMVRENPIVVIGKRGCCMCHVVRKLLLGLGVNPLVFEIDYDFNQDSLVLNHLINNNINNNNNNNVNNLQIQLPMVFVGGKLFGGLDKVMATHLSGDLIPVLKQAGALWL